MNWQNGQPVILEKGKEIPYIVDKEGLNPTPGTLTGNFTDRTAPFSLPLDDKWTFIRVPQKQWWKVENGELLLSPEEVSIREIANPAFIGRRIQHQCFEAETELSFYPASEKDFAGLVCYQSEKHYFAFGITRTENKICLSLRCAQGKEEQILNEQPLNSPTVSVKVKSELSLLLSPGRTKNMERVLYQRQWKAAKYSFGRRLYRSFCRNVRLRTSSDC